MKQTRTTIKASWRRVIAVKQYETETLELGLELDIDPKLDAVDAAADLNRQLAAAGDKLLVERTQGRVDPANEVSSEPLRHRAGLRPAKPTEPDPFV